ncbi:MAG: hypothetical protein H6581_03050 [Bacteroidia bacterium]|nr:hypothetical protein [Bacteroidia bacterium]
MQFTTKQILPLILMLACLFSWVGSARGQTLQAEIQPNPCCCLDSLVKIIDQDPDILHLDFTPAVHDLIGCGLPGAAVCIDLLQNPDPYTRLHAWTVIRGVARTETGWRRGSSFTQDMTLEFNQFMEANGEFDPDAEPAEQSGTIQRWQNWIMQRIASQK